MGEGEGTSFYVALSVIIYVERVTQAWAGFLHVVARAAALSGAAQALVWNHYLISNLGSFFRSICPDMGGGGAVRKC